MRLDANVRVETSHRTGGAFNFRFADIFRSEDHLSLQIRERHSVVVDDAERAYADRSKIKQDRRTKTAGAHDENSRGLEFGLTRSAHFAQHDVTGVPFEFAGIEHCG
jgi:hypothetical protein